MEHSEASFSKGQRLRFLWGKSQIKDRREQIYSCSIKMLRVAHQSSIVALQILMAWDLQMIFLESFQSIVKYIHLQSASVCKVGQIDRRHFVDM